MAPYGCALALRRHRVLSLVSDRTTPGPARPGRRVVLLGGPSGSGKSRRTDLAGCPLLNLYDFYFDGDQAGLPQARGIIDWDDPGSWDGEAALAAVQALGTGGVAVVPVYDITANRRTGSRVVDVRGAAVFVAEGIFAPELAPACRAARLDVDALYLDRPRLQNLVFRFVRDVRDHRKPVWVLIQRGLALWRAEPELRAYAVAHGCRPVSARAGLRTLRQAATPPQR